MSARDGGFNSLEELRRLFPDHFRTEIQLPEGRRIVNVHPATQCEGRGCVIHHPSAHRMVNWPMDLRKLPDGAAVTDRFCQHRRPHPDPDDVAYYASIGRDITEHECCPERCCGRVFAGEEDVPRPVRRPRRR